MTMSREQFDNHVKNSFPQGTTGVDLEGQVIVYTGLVVNDDGNLEPMSSSI